MEHEEDSGDGDGKSSREEAVSAGNYGDVGDTPASDEEVRARLRDAIAALRAVETAL